MKKILYIIPLLIGLVVLLASFGGDPDYDYPSGAPAGYTGSPADGQDCHACHGGTTGPITGVMTSNVSSSGYVPGTSYTITVTLTGSTAKGFEVSPQDLSGNLLGSLTAGSNNHITGSKYVTQNAKITASPAVWTFTWTAPAAGTGPVTFYGAFTLSKPVTKTSTMVIAENVTVPPVTATATANPSTIVSGSSSQLNVTAGGGTGSYTYAWTSNPPGFTSSQQNPTVNPTVNTTYTCLVTSGTQNASASTTVTVLPLLTASASANPSTIIEGNTSQLSVNATGGTGTYTYAWTSNPGGFTSSQPNPVVSPSVTTVYTCAVTSGTQNSSTNTTVTVIPVLSASATANPPSVIPGGSSQLAAIPAGGTGTYSYLWSSNPPGFTSTSQNPTVTPSVSTEYTVTITSGTQVASATTSVQVSAGLAAVASATPPAINPGETSQLDVYTSGGSGSETYSWTSDPPGFTSAEKNPQVSPSATTTYIVVVTSGPETATDSTTVTVYGTLSLLVSASPDQITAGETAQLTATPAGGSGTYTYSWTSDPPGFTSPEQNPVVSPQVTTTYLCTVTSGSQTATATVTVTVTEITGIPEGKDLSIRLWPNPAVDVVHVESGQDGSAVIYNLNGVIVLKEIIIRSGTNRISLNGLPAGVYLLQVNSAKDSGVFRFIRR